MRILLIGSGGREHALAYKIRQSKLVTELFIAPGNGGTNLEGSNVNISASDIESLVKFIKENSIDLVVPGPEVPLVLGITDACNKLGVACFGPDSYAANLEGSKSFSKQIMKESNVPTADFKVFTSYDEAVAYVKHRNCPLVVKADGLAAGKGVVVAKDANEACLALEQMMVKKEFGESGETVVIEDVLVGEEASFLAICSDNDAIALPSAQDHKAINDGDTGANTGGMGAYSPAPILPKERYNEIIEIAIKPILKTLSAKGHPFRGILYAGLMMTKDGPYVLEYNVRFGDPECQPLMMRLKSDIVECMLAAVNNKLSSVALEFTEESSLCVVAASKGYPGKYPSGMKISNISCAEDLFPGKVKVFHAGTSSSSGEIVATGGRVLGITALGDSLLEAKDRAYKVIECIDMEHIYYRKDIGKKGIK